MRHWLLARQREYFQMFRKTTVYLLSDAKTYLFTEFDGYVRRLKRVYKFLLQRKFIVRQTKFMYLQKGETLLWLVRSSQLFLVVNIMYLQVVDIIAWHKNSNLTEISAVYWQNMGIINSRMSWKTTVHLTCDRKTIQFIEFNARVH